MSNIKMWFGSKPEECDICGSKIATKFIDGKTRLGNGAWGILCTACHIKHGCGLGTGRGQQYELLDVGWVKTGG